MKKEILVIVLIIFISACTTPHQPESYEEEPLQIPEQPVEVYEEEPYIPEQLDEEMQEHPVEADEGESYIMRPKRETKPAFNVKFTHDIIDLSDYQSLTPPGGVSLNTFTGYGGLILKEGIERSPIYAPIDADVAGIVYIIYSDPWTAEIELYDISLIIHENLTLSFGGLGELAPKLKAVAPQESSDSSEGGGLSEPTSVEAGELLGYVVREISELAGWEFSAYDKSNLNIVANMDRHWNKWDNAPGNYVIAVCPYEYYPDDMKQEYLNLMPGKKCPDASRDVPGTIAGYWFADDSFNTQEDDFFYFGGDYSLRFVIASTEDGGVQWGGVGMGTDEADVGVSPTDPADLQVGDSFCYKNDLDWVDTGKNYLFVKLLSETELGVFYGEGKCPSSFPEEGYKVYLR